MNDWALGSTLFWLAVAIFVPAIIVHLAFGRKGGHHFFDKDCLSKDEVKRLPLEMIKKRTVWSLKGTAATVAGLAIVLVLYPMSRLAGLPSNIFGISDDQLILFVAGAVVLFVTLGLALYRKLCKC